VVDREKCTACGACIAACPKSLIELVPYKNNIRVSCNSKDMPKPTKENCSIGCMGCKICEKNCPSDAVHITDFIAKVDYDKCTQCGICTQKCPTKAIADITKKSTEVKEEDKETA
ncbi:MAG: 4Fe-4S binding protein, partial [Firmicutes bacterium]|nr:4Fe-4S binding protein [Bacillota bacterium]